MDPRVAAAITHMQTAQDLIAHAQTWLRREGWERLAANHLAVAVTQLQGAAELLEKRDAAVEP